MVIRNMVLLFVCLFGLKLQACCGSRFDSDEKLKSSDGKISQYIKIRVKSDSWLGCGPLYYKISIKEKDDKGKALHTYKEKVSFDGPYGRASTSILEMAGFVLGGNGLYRKSGRHVW